MLAFGSGRTASRAPRPRERRVGSALAASITPEPVLRSRWGRTSLDVPTPSADGRGRSSASATFEPFDDSFNRAGVGRQLVGVSRALGARLSGLSHFDVSPGMLANVPHCHSAEDELFVVLDGDGALELWTRAQHAGRRGAVAARVTSSRGRREPASRTPSGGRRRPRLLGYSDFHPSDMCFYPRSQKISLGGLGIRFRITALDYCDGEDEPRGRGAASIHELLVVTGKGGVGKTTVAAALGVAAARADCA